MFQGPRLDGIWNKTEREAEEALNGVIKDNRRGAADWFQAAGSEVYSETH